MPDLDLQQQEQQLVLLEDEVFDFDDLDVAAQQPPQQDQQQQQQQQAEPTRKPQRESAVERDVRDTRAMIASMLDGQRPLMTLTAMDTTPAAYLEYLRVIVNCGRLLRQPLMPTDLRQSVATLLAKAKPLFCANALNLIAQTVSACCCTTAAEEQAVLMPAFWSATFSQHECRLWVDLVETLLFFWAGDGNGGGGSGDAVFVESFAVGLLDRLTELRTAYSPEQMAVVEVGDAESRAERLARELRRRLRPRHLLCLPSGANGGGSSGGNRQKLSPAARSSKQPTKQWPSLLASAFACLLDAAGVLSASSAAPALPSLETAKASLESVTVEQACHALRLHEPVKFADNLPRIQRLRQRLAVSAMTDSGSLRTGLESAAAAAGIVQPADLGELLANFVAYASAAVEFEAAWQRAVVKDAASMSPFLLSRLSRVLAGNIGPARAVPGCWEALPERLREELEQQSARRLASVSAPQPGDSDGGDGASAAFEFDLVVLQQAEIRPEFLAPSSL